MVTSQIQGMSGTRQDGCRTCQIRTRWIQGRTNRDRADAGQVRCRTGRMQDKSDAEQLMQDRTDAGQDAYRTGQMQDRMDQ